jgi:hypothetical protein
MERQTHFVRAGQDAIDGAHLLGTPVEAACGKVWVPSRDPDAFPLCPSCLTAICDGWAA